VPAPWCTGSPPLFGSERYGATDERFARPVKAADDELIFTVAGGSRIDASNLMSRVLKPAAVEAGLGEWVPGGAQAPRRGLGRLPHLPAHLRDDPVPTPWGAVQVQRWLGHHKPSFTLDTYVHLLAEDIPEPAFADEPSPETCARL
jgi:hypothetical protein